ncbi:MAG TPA: FkbM family methyltransferase [Thermomicrobiales bacterium]|nr:FkbM family methyltransferase [Thermomicrobiales bacterium]
MSTAQRLVRKCVRSFGYDLARAKPDRSLGLYLATLFLHLGINCVIDVGAHFGEYGRSLRDNGYDGSIVSFEPVGANFKVLQQQCAHDPRWVAHRCALGGERGTADITVTGSSWFSSFRAPSVYGIDAFGRQVAPVGRETVRVERLDAVFGDCVAPIPGPRVFLKLDTQGWDLEVLRGAAGCLDRIAALQTELAVTPIYEQMPDFQEALASLRPMGFEVGTLFPVSHDPHLRLVEFDCVMLRVGAGRAAGAG